ncbi:hypothetical protein Tco_0648894 [Tanacetum coccineum]
MGCHQQTHILRRKGLSLEFADQCPESPSKVGVKIGVRSRVAHKVSLLTVTASRVIEMEDTGMASKSSRTPSVLEKSSLDLPMKTHPRQLPRGSGRKPKPTQCLTEDNPERPQTGLGAGSISSTPVAQGAPTVTKSSASKEIVPSVSPVGGHQGWFLSNGENGAR